MRISCNKPTLQKFTLLRVDFTKTCLKSIKTGHNIIALLIAGMVMRTSGILFLIIIFLAGCDSGQTQNMVKRESKVQKLLTTQKQLENHYTLNRTAKGVYIYTDRPTSTNIDSIFIFDDDIVNN